PAVAARLDALSALLAGGTRVPPMALAAVVHGELLALRPFAGPSGVVARAAARLTLVASGVDPRGLVAVEVGHLARRPEYVGAAGAFATGTRDGLRSWFRHYAAAVEHGAAELVSVAGQGQPGPT
ncbi:MAG TPA: oxidoreductase, partial [Micromonosporaceae bacterium]|nr:oxidoreductase [Micromonosporaceae bacterium]